MAAPLGAGGKVQAVAQGGQGGIGPRPVEVGRYLLQLIVAGVVEVHRAALGDQGEVVTEAHRLGGAGSGYGR